MVIEINEKAHEIEQGDTIVVNPNTPHQVQRRTEFLCQVIVAKSSGTKDKVTAA